MRAFFSPCRVNIFVFKEKKRTKSIKPFSKKNQKIPKCIKISIVKKLQINLDEQLKNTIFFDLIHFPPLRFSKKLLVPCHNIN